MLAINPRTTETLRLLADATSTATRCRVACRFNTHNPDLPLKDSNSMTIQKRSTGWLPATLAFKARSSLVTWMEFGSMQLREPFFEDTVRKLRLAFPPVAELTTDLDAVLDLDNRLPETAPQGLIFHISRCGSTLVANALRESQDIVVASEAEPVTNLLCPYNESVLPCTLEEWLPLQKKLLQSLVNIFAHYRTGRAERVIIKFASWNILSWSLVRSIWPDVPCVVLIRDPIEVMNSNLTMSTGWMKSKAYPLDAGGPAPAEMEETEYCARIIGKFCEAGVHLADENCRILDYEHLNITTIRDAAAFLGIEVGEDHLRRVLRVDAKDPRWRRPFHNDREAKQHTATESMRKAARLWSSDAYARVREKTSW